MADRITISSLSLRYAASLPEVLSNISLDIPAGTFCALLGPTGAGKSSLLHSLAGTLRRHHPDSVTSGVVAIGDHKFEGPPRDVLFPSVGLVLQDPHVQISGVKDTVMDEVIFTLENVGALPHDPEAAVKPMLERLGVGHLARRRPTSLSGGETQRVALATILIAEPAVLLLDEPTTALDLAAQGKLRSILKGMKRRTTILLSDTQPEFALGLCDQVVLLDRGVVRFNGSPASFLDRLTEFQELIPVQHWIKLRESLGNTGNNVLRRRILNYLGMQ